MSSKYAFSFLSLLMVSGASVWAADETASTSECRYYSGYVEMEGKLGDQRNLGMAEAFVPLACSPNVLFFTDLRSQFDNDSNREGNFGLGLRQLKDNGVVGGYAYFDRKVSGLTSKYHSQATLGSEWLAKEWEVRGNVYVPLSGEKTVRVVDGNTSAPFLQGSGIFVTEKAAELIKEEGMYGADVEVGVRMPELEKLWLHAGLFSFHGNEVPDVTGGRVRASYQITDYVGVLAEGQYDEVRGRQGWLGARLTIPLGGKGTDHGDDVARRMTASPVRDIDIVTSPKRVKQGVDRVYEATNTATGTTQRVIYVDNRNTDPSLGNGTRENPYTTLAAAQAAMQDHDIIYIASGDGTSTGMNRGFAISKDGVQVIGSGSAFIYDGTRLTFGATNNANGYTLIQAGVNPILTNTSTTILAGDGITVSGANVAITGLTVDDAKGYGIFAKADGANKGTLQLSDVKVINNDKVGIRIYTNGSSGSYDSVTLKNVVADTNAGHGVNVDQRAGSRIGTIDIEKIQTNANAGRGLYLLTDLNSVADVVRITDATSRNNTTGSGAGVLLEAYNGGKFMQSHITSVTAVGNASNGLSVNAYSGISGSISTYGTISLTGVTASGNAGSGIALSSSGYTTIGSVDMNDVTAVNNTGTANGVNITGGAQIGAIGSVKIENSRIVSNSRIGLNVATSGSGGIASLVVRNSEITGNRRDGILLNMDGTGSFNADLGSGTEGHNSIYGNGTENTALYYDVKLDLNNGTVQARNNWWGQAGGPIAGRIGSEAACPNCGTANTSSSLSVAPVH